MKRTLIWYHPRNREAAEALAEETPGAMVRSCKGWEGYVEEPADHVVVDNDAPDVAEAYEKDGASVSWLFDRGGTPDPEPEPEPEQEEVEPEGPVLPEGYRVEQRGSWYAVIGPDGEQVGDAKRDEADAIAQVVGEADAE